MRISDWSSDVCSSDLADRPVLTVAARGHVDIAEFTKRPVRAQVGQVGFPFLGIGVAGADFLAGLAEGAAGVDAGDLAQTLRHEVEAHITTHLPQLVARHVSHNAQEMGRVWGGVQGWSMGVNT